jgi:hypothetical protein
MNGEPPGRPGATGVMFAGVPTGADAASLGV